MAYTSNIWSVTAPHTPLRLAANRASRLCLRWSSCSDTRCKPAWSRESIPHSSACSAGEQLHYHPHIHCVVPGGGLAPDGTRWVVCRQHFLLPVRVLSRLFC